MSTGKRVLVTAGNTIVPIDQVRSITNIFDWFSRGYGSWEIGECLVESWV